MKIHVNQIPVEGLHVEGTEPAEILDLKEASVRPVSDVRYALDAGLSEGGCLPRVNWASIWIWSAFPCLERFRFRHACRSLPASWN